MQVSIKVKRVDWENWELLEGLCNLKREKIVYISHLKCSPSASPSAVWFFMLTDMHDGGGVISPLETTP